MVIAYVKLMFIIFVPSTTLSIKDSHSQYHLSESPTLTLERVDRNHAGIYQCLADNGVRDAVHVDIELTVLCK